MPVYSFEAMQADGKLRRGVIEGDTARGVRSLLRTQALVPLIVEPVGDAGNDVQSVTKTLRWSGRVFRGPNLAIWTRQLSGLISSSLPLERALAALADEAEDHGQRHIVAALRHEVNGGASFAIALSRHPHEFSTTFIAIIGAGEQSGRLGQVLGRLADDLEAGLALRTKITAAALYPIIVSGIAVVIMIFLMTYVVPQVTQVFAGTKQALPLLTVAMLALSGFLRGYGWIALGALGAAAWILRLALKNDNFREKFDAAALELPLVGRLLRDYNAARFTGTLALLTGAGLPILKALHAAAETLSNRAMRKDALDALVLVREGAPLASALAQRKRFPGLVSTFALLGEQMGELSVMLQRAAVQLSSEVQRRALALATLLEPLLIVVMGLMVMLVVLAVLLPIIQLNQWVK